MDGYYFKNTRLVLARLQNCLVDGWMGGWMGGWLGIKTVLKIAYSNQKLRNNVWLLNKNKSCWKNNKSILGGMPKLKKGLTCLSSVTCQVFTCHTS